jgi:aryl sulfotransferase
VITPAPAIAGTRVYQHHHLDSTRWDHVPYRDDDIVITTPYKCGTTWTQRIVCALLFGPDQPLTREISPWIDARFWGPIEPIAEATNALPHRRFMKSHLALDGIRWDDRVKFVVVGRDTRDVFMSLLNHYSNYTDSAMSVLNGGDIKSDPLPRYSGDPHALWSQWITRGWFEWEEDGWPFWSHHNHLATWWTARQRPNVLLVHYADLKADPSGEIGRLSDFLGLSPTAGELAEVVRVTSFDFMRREAIDKEAAAGGPDDGGMFAGGAAAFIYKGTNGRWRDLLTDDELAQYEARAARLDPAFRAWLERGRSRLLDAKA